MVIKWTKRKDIERLGFWMSKTVVVGMSGGVDSSVAAYLLKEQGYNVIGVTMQIWQSEDSCDMENNGGCCGLSAVEDARRVADTLGIPYYVMNFRNEFKHNVIDYFVKEYREGRTPNPCIACNRFVKWEALLNRSMEIGADYIATGHYARIGEYNNGRKSIIKSATAAKDQTYALYNLTQEQLSRTLLPVGEYTKERIREIAGEIGLPVAVKPDSQEICFVPDNDYASFIERETGEKENCGNFVMEDGTVVGTHKGISHYTIGQRKGLNIALGYPVYVKEIRVDTNEVILSGEEASIFTKTLRAKDINYMGAVNFEPGMKMTGKIRYSHAGEKCVVTKCDYGILELEFMKPVRAVTPGQAVVLYDGDYVLGGGTIIR